MNTVHPSVSVCIPTRNHARYIRQCLESVLEQAQDVNLQVLVGDDCSEDGTSEIIATLAAAHPGLVTHLRHEPRLGPTANMQVLMSRCTGTYIARMDGDDYWLPGKLRRQIEYLETHPDCSAVYTNALTIDENGSPIGLFNDAGDMRFDLPALLRHGNFLNNSSVLFRAAGRRAWLSATDTRLDFYMHLWHARFGYLAHISEPLTAYRVNTRGSMVASMNERVRELYWHAILSVPRDRVSDGDFAHGLADFLRRVTLRAVRTRQWHLLREWTPRVFAASPFGRARTSLLTLASILRILGKEFVGLFERGNDGRRLRVLYRR